jgi:hypothetical protein
MRSDLCPYSEEDALTLVVAGPVLVRFTEVSRNDWAVDCTDDLCKGDLCRRSCEHISSTDTAF